MQTGFALASGRIHSPPQPAAAAFASELAARFGAGRLCGDDSRQMSSLGGAVDSN